MCYVHLSTVSMFLMSVFMSVKGRWSRDSAPYNAFSLFHTSQFFPSSSCYWRSSTSSSSWMTWMSSDGELGRLAGMLGSRLSCCCCLPSSLLLSSSSMIFFHTLWFSVRCCMMLQNNLRRRFLLSAINKRTIHSHVVHNLNEELLVSYLTWCQLIF